MILYINEYFDYENFLMKPTVTFSVTILKRSKSKILPIMLQIDHSYETFS